jgi:hypothetical protein
MNILVAGATGGIGKNLCHFLNQKGHSVFTLSRNKIKAKEAIPFANEHFQWNENWFENLSNIDAIVNLTGSTIGKRWTKKYKIEILKSRIDTTREIVTRLNSFNEKSITFFSTSAIGIYPSSGDEVITEESSPGDNFLAQVCKQWEKEASLLNSPHRLVIGRFGLVFKKDDVALQRILMSYKFGFGVVIGNGFQWVSWIHIADLVRLITTSLENTSFEGIYNFVSPNPVRYVELIRSIGNILNKPFILSIPDYLIKIIFGEQASVLLASQRVIPKRLLDAGIEFEYPEIEKALKTLII